MSDQCGLFDLDERHQRRSAAGDPLENLGALIDFEIFRADLVSTLA
jgi:IS5 family transposase